MREYRCSVAGAKLFHIERDEVTGIEERYFKCPDGRITIQRIQNAEPFFRQNEKEFNSHSSKRPHFGQGLGRKVASIPLGFVEQILKERGLNLLTCSDDQIRRILNDREFSKLRTAPGRL